MKKRYREGDCNEKYKKAKRYRSTKIQACSIRPPSSSRFSKRSIRKRNRVNVRVIFAASCQPENPCANKVPHRSSNRVRFYQWPFGKWRIPGPSQRRSNEGLAFCALKYRLIAPGFCRRFCSISCGYSPSRFGRDRLTEYFRNLQFCPRVGSADFFSSIVFKCPISSVQVSSRIMVSIRY